MKTSSSRSDSATPTFTKSEQPKVYELFNKSSQYKPSLDRAKLITEKVAKFMVKDLRPFSVVSNDGFRDLVQTLDPKYVLPSRTYFSQTIIPDMYENVKSQVQASLSKALLVAITTDGWTSTMSVGIVELSILQYIAIRFLPYCCTPTKLPFSLNRT